MFDRCIYFNLVALTRRITKIWQREFAKLGLFPSHGYLLFAIAENPGASPSTMAELLELDGSTISRFLDLLVNRGLIERTRRGKGAQLHTTDDGLKVYDQVKAVMDRLYHQMQIQFGPSEFKEFVSLLHAARNTVENG